MKQDPQKINLSLVSHTNVGKTTLARTLLGRDIGEVEDRSHVTTEPEDYVLLRAPDDSELILWDTPGFGDSVRLAKRLAGRSNPIGWFTSEVWDRLTDRTLWLNQQALKHIKDISNVILYLVNASESPDSVPYVKAEMEILTWIDKPVIVLLNQMGEILPREEENKEVQLWKDFLSNYKFIVAVLPLDAFARCWAQEYELWDEIGKALPPEQQAAFTSLKATWVRQKQALYSSSMDAMAGYLVKLSNDKEILAAQSLVERLRAIGRTLGFIKKDLHGEIQDAQVALSTRAADWLCNLTQKLISINGLEGKGVKGEILRRMRTDWVTEEKIDTTA
ncbi:GTPase domain-containing protein, partial [Turicimonas muris]